MTPTETLTTDTLVEQLVRQITRGYHWIAIGHVPWRMTCRAFDVAVAERYGPPGFRYFRCRRLFVLIARAPFPAPYGARGLDVREGAIRVGDHWLVALPRSRGWSGSAWLDPQAALRLGISGNPPVRAQPPLPLQDLSGAAYTP